ncbi:uncharacterized protein LOC113320322 [Papaver somniferum]|uniref:uncharacterized protein LOC113320322 n=1 Tax=Papaver somniferum TaxID=3469 RepID=UPI000E6F9069|nr:uncharacterized protein LOC113320322 [Papaver somniferum]
MAKKEALSFLQDKKKLEEARKRSAELEKQLEEERAARQSLDEELNELVNQHEEELEVECADKNKKLSNLHVEFKVMMTNACKAAVFRERQRVASANTFASVAVHPLLVHSETEKVVPNVAGGEDRMDTDQSAPGDGQT